MEPSPALTTTINSFFEACRAGAFINNPTEAHRAIRSLEGFRKITSKKIRDLAGDEKPGDTLDILLKLVVVVLDDMRRTPENKKKLSVFLNY